VVGCEFEVWISRGAGRGGTKDLGTLSLFYPTAAERCVNIVASNDPAEGIEGTYRQDSTSETVVLPRC